MFPLYKSPTSCRAVFVTVKHWSRRQWLTRVGALLFAVWLAPVQKVLANSIENSSHIETLRVLADALIPADELTPAASTLGVHHMIFKDAEQDASLQLLISDGLRWLDETFGSVAMLDSDQLQRLLLAMSEADWNSGPRNFFHEIRDRAVMHYFSDPRAWNGSAINRPPQPMGYPEAIAT